MSRLSSFLIIGAFIVGAPFLIYYSIMHDRNVVSAMLEEEGYQDISLSTAWFNRAPMQCAGKHVAIYTYTATYNGKAKSGFACYQGWPWSAKHWDN